MAFSGAQTPSGRIQGAPLRRRAEARAIGAVLVREVIDLLVAEQGGEGRLGRERARGIGGDDLVEGRPAGGQSFWK